MNLCNNLMAYAMSRGHLLLSSNLKRVRFVAKGVCMSKLVRVGSSLTR